MKIWKRLLKYAACGLMLTLALPLTGCVKDKRFDYTELNVRLEETAPQFTFTYTDLFFADGVYYCYYSFSAPEDALLTMKEDQDGKLDRVTLTLAAFPPPAASITVPVISARLSLDASVTAAAPWPFT